MLELPGSIRFSCNHCNTILCLSRDDIEPTLSYIDHGENGMGEETIYLAKQEVCCPECGNIIQIIVSGNEYPQWGHRIAN